MSLINTVDLHTIHRLKRRKEGEKKSGRRKRRDRARRRARIQAAGTKLRKLGAVGCRDSFRWLIIRRLGLSTFLFSLTCCRKEDWRIKGCLHALWYFLFLVRFYVKENRYRPFHDNIVDTGDLINYSMEI